MIRSVLLHAGDRSGNEVRQYVLGCGGPCRVVVENSEVIKVADDSVLLKREFAAEVQCMPALHHAEDITHPVKVRRAHWSGQAATNVEVSRNIELRQRLRSLDRK